MQGAATLASAPVDSLVLLRRADGTRCARKSAARRVRACSRSSSRPTATRWPSNDTLSFALDVARGASAVFASTAPDEDARYALDVLRGTLAVPTRGYFRVAPGRWVQDGSLAAVSEDDVRRSVAEAPLAVLHGDTAIFGAPRAFTRGALALHRAAGAAGRRVLRRRGAAVSAARRARRTAVGFAAAGRSRAGRRATPSGSR